MGFDQPVHWLVIIAVGLILFFGYKKLPEMARSAGKSLRIFKTEMKGMADDDDARDAAKQQATLPPTPAVQQPVQQQPVQQQPAQQQPVQQPVQQAVQHSVPLAQQPSAVAPEPVVQPVEQPAVFVPQQAPVARETVQQDPTAPSRGD